MPEKRMLPGWKVFWVASEKSLLGYLVLTNGSITKDPNGRIVLEAGGYDTSELVELEKKTLSLKNEWEW